MDLVNIRGEVELTGPEYEAWTQRLNAAIGDVGGGGVVCWRLAPIEYPQRIAKPARSQERPLSLAISESEKPKPKQKNERERREYTPARAPEPEPEPGPEHQVEYDPSDPICKLLVPAKEDFDKLAEWSKSLHAMVVALCKTRGAEAFASSRSDSATTNAKAAATASASEGKSEDAATSNDESVPSTATGKKLYFDGVLTKLLSGEYKNSTEALNELYMVLVAAFRGNAPGSNSWMAAQVLSQRLQQLRQRFNISDAQRQSRDNTQFVQRIESSFRDASIDPFEPIVAPVTNKERLSFYQTLLGLGLDDHLELFTKFEHSAIWKSVQEGEIELDDQATDPQVFRRMLDWALAKRTRFLCGDERMDLARGAEFGAKCNVTELDN